MGGRGRTAVLKGDSFPAIPDLEPWDGKDGEVSVDGRGRGWVGGNKLLVSTCAWGVSMPAVPREETSLFKIAVYPANVKPLVIIRHVIHSRFTLPLLFVTHVCTCRPVPRRSNFPQLFLHDSRLIYTFGKLIFVKLVTSHCDLLFAICTINGNLKLSNLSEITARSPMVGTPINLVCGPFKW